MSTTELVPIVGPEPRTPAWHEAHHHCIGASRAAAACGLSRYEQPLDIYLEVRGLKTREETPAMRLGLLLEPVVVAEYEHRTQQVTQPCNLLFHPQYPFIGATPDRVVVTAEPQFPLEAKTSSFRRAGEFGEEGTDDIPVDYLLQAQQQMLVTMTERCDVAVLLDGRTLRLYTIRRHEKLIAGIIVAETELWQRIQAGDPPPPDWRHPSTPDLVKSLYGVEDKLEVVLSDASVDAWGDCQALGAKIKELEAEREIMRARVLLAMGEAAIGILPGGNQLVRQSVNVKEHVRKASSYVKLSERKAKT